ncbi:LysR substrate-binding domain-containing protein [Herbaspirillum rhizosphaerae]|uniref:LysR substrate-binding domain-containing protein n=1 Tax=Herbaspirillum rhizosphaerae TaxID=346179 RepID=UPI00067D0606|nr:LysR substrate-binding domain-containing protein [Herbaspirillum rhizosphaerae]
MRKLPPLGTLRVFEAAARHLSFKDAASELNVTPTAVSHQIKQLEDVLGVKLFERGVREVRLTASGRSLFPTLREGLDSFESAIAAITSTGKARVATLSSTVAFMARRLAPKAGSFRSAYPDWTLRLDASDDPVDLDSYADAAIRYGSGRYPDLIAEPLFRDRVAPVCSPNLGLKTVEDLSGMTLIHFDWGLAARGGERAPMWRDWLFKAGISGVESESGLSFTDEIHAVQATLAGQGVGLLSLTLVAEEIASGILVQPFGLSLESHDYTLVYSPRAAERPSTMLLRDWVRTQFSV